MTKDFKKKSGFIVALILGWAFQFILIPFYHFHPSDLHSHKGGLQPHKHEGHLYSHELETIAHVLNLHPQDPDLDRNRHHSHSSAEHDADQNEIDLHKAGIQTEKPSQKINTDHGVLAFSSDLKLVFVHLTPFEVFHFQESSPTQNPKERSPPFLLI